MKPETRLARRVIGGLAILLAAAALAAAGRGFTKPYAPDAPDYRSKGAADAPVVIAEFSDFQCSACAAASKPLKQITTLFPGKVRVVFKHLPWDFHTLSKDAAVAAECAGRAGRFWEFHDAMFAKQYAWAGAKQAAEARKRFMEYAAELGVDRKAFAACLDDPAALAAIEADRKEAEAHWVRSTPTFFINGKRFVGALQLRTHGLNRIEDILKG
ncbi:MAG: thioredoxin domain-containing protein [Elusimicrobiota bacterium]